MSIRSNRGPEIRFWYFVTADGAQVQGLMGSFSQPQGKGWTQSDRVFVFSNSPKDYCEVFPARAKMSDFLKIS